jgi:hypothetical protein
MSGVKHFGRGIGRRPDNPGRQCSFGPVRGRVSVIRQGGFPADKGCDPEIADERAAVDVEEKIRWLQVPVNDALLVGMIDSPGHLLHQLENPFDPTDELVLPGRYTAARHEVHHEIRPSGGNSGRVDRDDIRVPELCQDPRLAFEPFLIGWGTCGPPGNL